MEKQIGKPIATKAGCYSGEVICQECRKPIYGRTDSYSKGIICYDCGKAIYGSDAEF